MVEPRNKQPAAEVSGGDRLADTLPQHNPHGNGERAGKHGASGPATHAAAGWSSALRTPLVLGLGGLLATQLLLAAVLGGGDRALAPAAPDTPLVQFDPEQIDHIEIATADGASPMVLSRADSGWMIPALGDFPADIGRVDELMRTLAELRRPLPLATSAAARERFKVADGVFDQRIALKNGSRSVATLILGDSPGFRRRYLRPAGDEGIYDLRFEVFNLSDQPNDWIAHDQLRLERDQIQRIAGADWTLTKDGEDWRLTGGGDARSALDQAKVAELLSTLANLSYREVLGTEAPVGFDPDAPMLALDIGLADGETERYLVAPLAVDDQGNDSDNADPPLGENGASFELGEKGQDYVLKVADRPYYFRLADFDLGPLVGFDPSRLLQAPGSHDAEAPDTPSAEAATESSTASD